MRSGSIPLHLPSGKATGSADGRQTGNSGARRPWSQNTVDVTPASPKLVARGTTRGCSQWLLRRSGSRLRGCCVGPSAASAHSGSHAAAHSASHAAPAARRHLAAPLANGFARNVADSVLVLVAPCVRRASTPSALNLRCGLVGALTERCQAGRQDSYCKNAQSAFHRTTSVMAGRNLPARSKLGEDTDTS